MTEEAEIHTVRAGRIDWHDIHRQMEMIQAAIDRGYVPTAEEKKRILKERARALALEPVVAEETREYLEIIAFQLAEEKYGIESAYVREVYPLRELTPVPCTPPFVLGMTKVRGKIMSVIDIKKFFDLPEKGLTELDKIIIVHSGEMELGIRADAILGVQSIPTSEIQRSLPTLTDSREKYLKGIGRELIVILDMFKLLSDSKITVHEEV